MECELEEHVRDGEGFLEMHLLVVQVYTEQATVV